MPPSRCLYTDGITPSRSEREAFQSVQVIGGDGDNWRGLLHDAGSDEHYRHWVLRAIASYIAVRGGDALDDLWDGLERVLARAGAARSASYADEARRDYEEIIRWVLAREQERRVSLNEVLGAVVPVLASRPSGPIISLDVEARQRTRERVRFRRDEAA